ncbi:cilia- and flagella-associated protein 53-like [Bradysia coprophila]|uniref:cilia- and flagella-associated protein 53-like n=1 Tax=Bradysia coprophila TaxID=38358 RepID=UPI00187DD133|nr:cilia- and flagella-associated protein 53-like [Bradysia coprophila]
MPLRRAQINSVKNSYMESIRSDANTVCQNQFIAITDRRVKSGKAQSLAKQLSRSKEESLQQKRERLRDLLSTEATLYEQELVDNHRNKTEENFKSRENRLLGLKSERERQRLKFVEEMRVQRLINSCDEIRPYLRQKLQDECKNCQQLQIFDNTLKKAEELDRERLWDEVQKQVFNQMTQREFDEFLVSRNRNLNDQQFLRKQMLEKNEIRDQVEYEADTMHCGKVFGDEPSEQDLFMENKRKQIQLAQDLLAQQAENDRTKKTIREGEILHDLAAIDKITNELRIEKQNARMEKRQNMKESLQFLGYMKKMEENKTKVERERDSLTESMHSGKTNEYLKNRNYFTQQRDEFYKSIYEERRKQIVVRRRQMLEEKSQRNNEIIEAAEMFANSAYIERELRKEKKNDRLKYGQELRAQSNYEKLDKLKAATSSNKLTEIIAKEEAHKTELIKNNLGRMHEIYPVHPNFQAILNSKN